MDDETYVNEWIKHPDIIPEEGEVENAHQYYLTYEYCYDYLRKKKKMSAKQIQEKLPKIHWLFDGAIDFCYFSKTGEKHFSEDDIKVYNFYTMYNPTDYEGIDNHFQLDDYGGNEKNYVGDIYDNKNEKNFIYAFVDNFIKNIIYFMEVWQTMVKSNNSKRVDDYWINFYIKSIKDLEIVGTRLQDVHKKAQKRASDLSTKLQQVCSELDAILNKDYTEPTGLRAGLTADLDQISKKLQEVSDELADAVSRSNKLGIYVALDKANKNTTELNAKLHKVSGDIKKQATDLNVELQQVSSELSDAIKNDKKKGINEHLFEVIKSDWCIEVVDTKAGTSYFDQFHQLFKKSNNIYNTLICLLKELLKVKKDFPFSKIPVIQAIKPIEDPLITIMKKIGGKDELHKYLYLIDDELDAVSRSPRLDEPVTTPSTAVSKSKRSARSQRLAETAATPTVLLKPSYKYLSAVPEKFTQDNKLSQIDKKVLKLYRELIDYGLLDLMARAELKPKTSDNKILTYDKTYYNNNVLFQDDNISGKCIDNTDAITQDKFDSKNYPLAKLQLMYQLFTYYTKDNDTAMRTDCFYAPAFYNYVVNKVLEQQKKDTIIIPHPLIKDHNLNDDDINRLMDIMKLVIPDIVNPIYPVYYDKFLKIKTTNIGNFIHINVVRTFCNLDIIVCQVCVIPNDPNSKECIEIIQKLFDEKVLLHTYIPPYFIYKRIYVKFAEISEYNSPAQWKNNAGRKLQMYINNLKVLTEYI